MMEYMRKAAKSWVAMVLLGLLIVSFAIFGISDIFTTSPLSSKDLATIGSRSISVEQFRNDLQQRIQTMTRNGASLSMEQARQLGIDRQLLEELVANASIDEKAANLGVHVSAAQIGQEIANNPAFRDGAGKFDPQGFRNVLINNGLTENGYINSERQQRTRQSMLGLTAERKASKTYLDIFNQYANETREGRYFTTQVSEADLPKPTDAELKKQYDENPTLYTAPEFRTVAVLKVEPSDIMAKITPAEEELTAFYDDKKLEYFEEERRTILQLTFPTLDAAKAAKTRLDAGEDFKKIAAELKLADKDFTFTNKTRADFIDPKIAEAAFAGAAGSVSAPIEGGLATAILKIETITPEKQQSFAEAKADVMKRVQLNRAREEIDSIYAAVEDARAGQTKFEDIAQRADIPLTIVKSVSIAGQDKDGVDMQMPAKQDILKATFGSDVGVENDALTINDGYVWFEVRDITPSALKPYDQVKADVAKDWAKAAMRKLASTKAEEMIALTKSGSTLESLAAQRQANVIALPAVKRDNAKPEFNFTATQALFNGTEKSVTWAPGDDDKTIVLIEVGKSVVPPISLASAETKTLSETITSGLSQDMFQIFGKAAKQSAKAVINEDIWKQFESVAATQ